MSTSSLGQYYTENGIGRLVASNFSCESPGTVLELGVGKGSLISAVQERWKSIKVISTDIDHDHRLIKSSFPQGRHYRRNVIDDQLPKNIEVKERSIDIAVCNPPYIPLALDVRIRKILDKSGFEPTRLSNTQITADLVFLAQNLRFLRHGGELGIILPDSYLSGHNYEWVREGLIRQHCISSIIDLPEKIFEGTEAKTHILMLTKGYISESPIPLIKVSKSFKKIDEILVDPKDALYRMDYAFHKWKASKSVYFKNCKTLSDISAEIKRGNSSRKDYLESGLSHFHTTDFKNCKNSGVYLKEKQKVNGTHVYAEPGDILMARVGKRCVGKVILIKRGSIPISDCVYRIRVPKEYRSPVYKALSGKSGIEWVLAHAHGVCSKVISKKDLLSFQIKE